MATFPDNCLKNDFSDSSVWGWFFFQVVKTNTTPTSFPSSGQLYLELASTVQLLIIQGLALTLPIQKSANAFKRSLFSILFKIQPHHFILYHRHRQSQRIQGSPLKSIPLPQGRISYSSATIIADDTQELVISGSSFTHALAKHIIN